MADTGTKFPLGKLVQTCGVNDRSESDPEFAQFVQASLSRHAAGDWGDMGAEDKALNDRSLTEVPGRLMSAYTHETHPKIWIITEWDRSVTTVLFPEEY